MTNYFVFLEKLLKPLVQRLFFVLRQIINSATDFARFRAHLCESSARVLPSKDKVRPTGPIKRPRIGDVENFSPRPRPWLYGHVDRLPFCSVVLSKLFASERPRCRPFMVPWRRLHCRVLNVVTHQAKRTQHKYTATQK